MCDACKEKDILISELKKKISDLEDDKFGLETEIIRLENDVAWNRTEYESALNRIDELES